MKRKYLLISIILLLALPSLYYVKAWITPDARSPGRDSDVSAPIRSENALSGDETSYQRIISLAPSITEILFALGAGDRVVGVTKFCDYPPEAKTREKVGGYYDTAYEAILMLEPDLIIMLPEHETQKRYLQDRGYPILTVDQRDTQGIVSSMLSIGRVCGQEKRAREMIADISERMSRIREKTRGLPSPRVLICIGRTIGQGTLEDLFICGKMGFYNEMLMLSGGKNAYEAQSIQYPTVSGEGITRMDPEIIIDIIPDLQSLGLDESKAARDWHILSGVSAVKNRRIHVLGQDYVATPGPRFIMTLEQMARAIHPEIDWES
ncbi:MAG: ABC transporter substrate-binding protein [bacterium]